jgi:histidine kinase/DNA gyrase B/HSP90-like ATPase
LAEEVHLRPKADSFHLIDGVDDFSKLIAAIAPIFDESSTPWHLDLSDCFVIGIGAATTIVAALLDSRRRGRLGRITLPKRRSNQPDEFDAFLEASGLNHYCAGSDFPKTADSTGLAMPIRQLVEDTSFNDPGAILSFLRRNRTFSSQKEEFLRICVHEAIQNVQDHSNSRIGTIIGCHIDASHLTVAVVDCGIGIAASLRRRYADVPNAEAALSHVFAGGHSAKSKPSNLGQGISNMRAILTNQLEGRLMIYSEDRIEAKGANGWERKEALSARIPGTGVFMSVLLR